MDKSFRRAIQKADKYVRNKEYLCLLPGCKKKAIRSHGVPRAACAAALADAGILYTRRQSFNGIMRMITPNDPPDVIEVGVNEASVFKGYCSDHDMLLFRSAETTDRRRKNGMFIAQHLRALSLEYCRKREVIDFHKKMLEFTTNLRARAGLVRTITEGELIASSFHELYLGSLFNMIGGADIDKVDYWCIPFSKNLQVSCCGCFDRVPGAFDSVIAYNLVSYADMTVLVLTAYNAVKRYLDSFIEEYSLPQNVERLVNDIAFWHCEEPLIAVRLWRSLDDTQKLSIRNSLRHPHFRTEMAGPRIIKVDPSDLHGLRSLTPEMWARLPFFRQDEIVGYAAPRVS